MVSYKELGLVNTREMFAKAVDGGYAIPAFNFNNMEQLQAIIQAASRIREKRQSPDHYGKLRDPRRPRVVGGGGRGAVPGAVLT